jgi:hypothetical protein
MPPDRCAPSLPDGNVVATSATGHQSFDLALHGNAYQQQHERGALGEATARVMGVLHLSVSRISVLYGRGRSCFAWCLFSSVGCWVSYFFLTKRTF